MKRNHTITIQRLLSAFLPHCSMKFGIGFGVSSEVSKCSSSFSAFSVFLIKDADRLLLSVSLTMLGQLCRIETLQQSLIFCLLNQDTDKKNGLSNCLSFFRTSVGPGDSLELIFRAHGTISQWSSLLSLWFLYYLLWWSDYFLHTHTHTRGDVRLWVKNRRWNEMQNTTTLECKWAESVFRVPQVSPPNFVGWQRISQFELISNWSLNSKCWFHCMTSWPLTSENYYILRFKKKKDKQIFCFGIYIQYMSADLKLVSNS